MKIAIGTDHRGVELKNKIIEKLADQFEFIDKCIGNHDGDDYPDYALSVCKEIINNTCDFGVLLCGTGIGMSIVANKIEGIRCALVHSKEEAHLAKEHNNANVLAFSSKMSVDEISDCIIEFSHTNFSSEERHKRRVEKIISIERGEYFEH